MKSLILSTTLIFVSGLVQAVILTPDPNDVPRPGGGITITAEDLYSARSIWNEKDESDNIEADALHELGRVFYREGQLDDARNAWQRASNRDPNLPSASLMIDLEKLYALMSENKEAEKAQSLLREMETKFASDPHFHLVRGEQALRSRNAKAALESFARAYQLNPSLYVSSLGYARIYDFLGEHPKARKLYIEATESAPDKGRPWTYLGSHQFRGGEYDDALTSFKRGREVDLRLPPAEAEMARLSAEAKDFIGARYWYLAALASSKEGNYVLRTSLIDVLLELRLLEEARVEIEKVLKAGERASLLTTLGYIAEEQGNDEKALKYYRRAIKIDSKFVVAYNNLSMLLIRKGSDPANALELARTAREVAPDSAMVLGTFACALQAAGQKDEAARVLPLAVQLNVSDAWTRYCYGLHLYEAGERKKATMHLEGAMLLDTEFPHSARIRKLIGN